MWNEIGGSQSICGWLKFSRKMVHKEMKWKELDVTRAFTCRCTGGLDNLPVWKVQYKFSTGSLVHWFIHFASQQLSNTWGLLSPKDDATLGTSFYYSKPLHNLSWDCNVAWNWLWFAASFKQGWCMKVVQRYMLWAFLHYVNRSKVSINNNERIFIVYE